MTSKILVIDDESSMLDVIEAMLINENHEVFTFQDACEGIEYYKNNSVDLVISDIKMSKIDGITVLSKIKDHNPDALVILITAYANAQDALQALKIGAYDYIQKPFKIDKLRKVINRALSVNKVLSNNLKKKIQPKSSPENFHGIITKNEKMMNLFKLINKAAPSKTTILIHGESGTGKELFAKAIHHCSGREKEPFIAINCGALPENLLESELFGHIKGSFTGAVADKIGLFKAAKNGTLFLDEISSLSLNLQSKLLRVLQEKEIRPVGSIHTTQIDCRVVAATNISLEELIERKNFREDLYYRLNIIPIDIPPLRDRPEDLCHLIEHFIKKYSPSKHFEITPETQNILLEYHWPGNVRELENAIERAVTLSSDNKITSDDLPPFIQQKSAFKNLYDNEKILPLKQFTIMAEGQYILSILQKFGGNKKNCSKELEIDIITLSRKIERFENLTHS